MAPSLDLMDLLGQIPKNQPEIRLLNIYKGLPINYDASISSVGIDDIRVLASKYQLACLYHQGETYIQANKLTYTIKSQVMSLNLGREEAVLSNFELAPNTIGNRMNIRVEPGNDLNGVLQFKGYPNKVVTPIADISIYGTSVFVDDFLFPVRLFQPGNDISMAISFPAVALQKPKKVFTSQLSETRNTRSRTRNTSIIEMDGNVDINAWGKILSVRPDPQNRRYRVSIKFYIKDPERMLVSQYISLRQSEIIHELQVLTNELYDRTK